MDVIKRYHIPTEALFDALGQVDGPTEALFEALGHVEGPTEALLEALGQVEGPRKESEKQNMNDEWKQRASDLPIEVLLEALGQVDGPMEELFFEADGQEEPPLLADGHDAGPFEDAAFEDLHLADFSDFADFLLLFDLLFFFDFFFFFFFFGLDLGLVADFFDADLGAADLGLLALFTDDFGLLEADFGFEAEALFFAEVGTPDALTLKLAFVGVAEASEFAADFGLLALLMDDFGFVVDPFLRQEDTTLETCNEASYPSEVSNFGSFPLFCVISAMSFALALK